MKIAVIGCGVIGLTTGIRLIEEGFEVEILTKEVSPKTVSDIAAAFWFPYRAEPKHRVLPWANKSYIKLAELSKIANSGVFAVDINHFYYDDYPDPWWASSVMDFKVLGSKDLAANYKSGLSYKTYLMESPVYMPFLMDKFITLGGVIKIKDINNFDELDDNYNAIINCTGVYAAQLTEDKDLFPIRGQVIKAEKPAAFQQAVIDAPGIFAVIRNNDLIIGGANEDNNWSLEPRESDRDYLLANLKLLKLDISELKIEQDLVGLRPGRSEVRLEKEIINERILIHNYGHAGAGYTLSWGCAEEVLNILRSESR